jgi:Lipocalin-like domain
VTTESTDHVGLRVPDSVPRGWRIAFSVRFPSLRLESTESSRIEEMATMQVARSFGDKSCIVAKGASMNKCLALLATLAVYSSIGAAQTSPLVGTWTLAAADIVKTDGTRTEDYGPRPRGLAVFTADGHYLVAIFRAERLKFASNDKSRGTPEEFKEASLGMSTHFGTYSVDVANGTIAFRITSASFPNWDDTTQVRQFTLIGDELTWRVPPRPDGSVPVSSFKRVR